MQLLQFIVTAMHCTVCFLYLAPLAFGLSLSNVQLLRKKAFLVYDKKSFLHYGFLFKKSCAIYKENERYGAKLK